MKNVTKKIVVVFPMACMLAAAQGCSHQDRSVSSAPNEQEEQQFVQDVGNQPAGQRQAYVQSHRDKFVQIKMDPDKTEITQLNSLMPKPGTP